LNPTKSIFVKYPRHQGDFSEVGFGTWQSSEDSFCSVQIFWSNNRFLRNSDWHFWNPGMASYPIVPRCLPFFYILFIILKVHPWTVCSDSPRPRGCSNFFPTVLTVVLGPLQLVYNKRLSNIFFTTNYDSVILLIHFILLSHTHEYIAIIYWWYFISLYKVQDINQFASKK
jgi:hypothetical protein